MVTAPMAETDVLVVGSGPAGASAALFLASYGTPTLMITKYSRLSDSPRAHITNQRTMETMRDMGVEDVLMREATPWEYMGNTTFCTSLAGEELGRIPSWGTDTARHADYELQSPCTMLDAPQTITEPILVQAAQERGAQIRFDTEYLSHTQDETGVTSIVRDRLTGSEYTYDAERAPIARQIVERANQSIVDTGKILTALDLTDTTDVARLDRQLALRKEPGPAGEKVRAALREAIAYKAYEFDAHGVEHNQRYASAAVVPDGTPMPEYQRDPELYAQPTTWPGAKLPHTWVTRGGRRVSTLDLAGHGRFTLVTGIGGQPWLDAAAELGAELRLAITPALIGPGQPYEDPYGTWAALREIDDGGVLLVRPDLYVAARHLAAPASPEQARDWLAATLSAILARPA